MADLTALNALAAELASAGAPQPLPARPPQPSPQPPPAAIPAAAIPAAGGPYAVGDVVSWLFAGDIQLGIVTGRGRALGLDVVYVHPRGQRTRNGLAVLPKPLDELRLVISAAELDARATRD